VAERYPGLRRSRPRWPSGGHAQLQGEQPQPDDRGRYDGGHLRGAPGGGALNGGMAPGDVADFTQFLTIGTVLFGVGVLQVPACARRQLSSSSASLYA
jgi:hypothetical protein